MFTIVQHLPWKFFILTSIRFIRVPQNIQYYQTIHKFTTLSVITYIWSNNYYKLNQKTSQVQEIIKQQQNNNHISLWQNFVSLVAHFIRIIHLCIIFTPPITLLPLLIFKRTTNYWLDVFVKSIERAGVIWIKTFQYLSHRRDIIGEKLAEKFVHLRENAPQHTFSETKKNFKQTYGKDIQSIFQEFNQKPLASGSVSQVYKATYKGKKVAVKVRHPNVDRHIERDINILFGFSKLMSYFSSSFQIPVSSKSLKKTLIDQIDFNIEKDNLNIFNKMFEDNSEVKFPFPFQQATKDSVLIETFAQGVPITYFQTNKHPLNAVIARIGATTFFQMLMKNNFIHADCHGGNILVQIKQQSSSFFSEIWGYLKQQLFKIQEYLMQNTINSEILRKLYAESKKQQAQIRRIIRACKEKVEVTLIDVGMVITLNEKDRLNFVNFLKSLIKSEGQECAQMIYKLSNYDGKKILAGQFEEYLNDLKELFAILNNQELDDLDGMKLLGGMLILIREYQMKLDGQFATLLTNMMVLQAMAKDIHPEINILKCAIPYFEYVQ